MTLNDALKQLKALGNEKVRKQNAKGGAGDNQFGVVSAKSGRWRRRSARTRNWPCHLGGWER